MYSLTGLDQFEHQPTGWVLKRPKVTFNHSLSGPLYAMESVCLYFTFVSGLSVAQRWSYLFYRNVNEWKNKSSQILSSPRGRVSLPAMWQFSKKKKKVDFGLSKHITHYAWKGQSVLTHVIWSDLTKVEKRRWLIRNVTACYCWCDIALWLQPTCRF